MHRPSELVTAGHLARMPALEVHPDSDALAVANQLCELAGGEAAVLDPEGRFIGLLTEGQCLEILAEVAYYGGPPGPVVDYLHRPLPEVTLATDIFTVVRRMRQEGVEAVVVTERERFAGVVTRRDVLVALQGMVGYTHTPRAVFDGIGDELEEEEALPLSSRFRGGWPGAAGH